MTVIDASGATIGRLGSLVAKRLLSGEEIFIINAEQAIVSGTKDAVVAVYRQKREVGGTKRKGPFVSRMPHLILKRTIRGMLPYQHPNGRKAYKHLKVYIGIPETLKNIEAEHIEMRRPSHYITLKDLSSYLGIPWQK